MMSWATRSCSDIEAGTPDAGAVLWVLLADLAAPAVDGGVVAAAKLPAMRRAAPMSREESICLHYSDGRGQAMAKGRRLLAGETADLATA